MLTGRLETLFSESEELLAPSLPIRKTRTGIWVPTPIPIILKACEILTTMRLLGETAPKGSVVDAGSGDGRVPIVISLQDQTRWTYGIEFDRVLHSQATNNLNALKNHNIVGSESKIQLIENDYTNVETYRLAGIATQEVHLFLNYPDGNQNRLERLITEKFGFKTWLCLLTHDEAINLNNLNLEERQNIQDDHDMTWWLSLYRQPRSRA